MELLKLKLSDIVVSPTNPREDFDKVELANLAEDIKKRGLLQPILVRKKGKGYEIIAGERRFKAHELIANEFPEKNEINCVAVEMTDLEAEEAQLVENEKRDNLKLLEKAKGYAGFMKRHNINVDALALKLGISRSNAYATVRCNKLHPDAKKALKDGTLKESLAKLLAQVHSSRQAEATKDVLSTQFGERMTVRQATHHLQTKFFLDLRKALFDTEDAELDKEAGPCTSCEKRTGAQPDLPLDGAVVQPDQCTEPPCWSRKTQLTAAARAEKLGVELLDEKEVAKAFSKFGDLQPGSGYVKADQVHTGSSTEQKYSELLSPDLKKQQMVVALDPRGHIVELVKQDGLAAAIEQSGRLKKRESKPAAKTKAKSRKTPAAAAAPKVSKEEAALADAKAEFDDTVRGKLGGAVVAALIAAVEKGGASKKMLAYVAQQVLVLSDADLNHRGVKEPSYVIGRSKKLFDKNFGKYSPAQLVGLTFEAANGSELVDAAGGDVDAVEELVKDLGVDVKKIEAAVRAATPKPKALLQLEAQAAKPKPAELAKVAGAIETEAVKAFGKKGGKAIAGAFKRALKKGVKKAAKKSGPKKKAA